jgi:hypothetical protein
MPASTMRVLCFFRHLRMRRVSAAAGVRDGESSSGSGGIESVWVVGRAVVVSGSVGSRVSSVGDDVEVISEHSFRMAFHCCLAFGIADSVGRYFSYMCMTRLRGR